MENLNAAKIIEECKMSGEEVVNIVAAHGEDQFIHVVDIEEFAENHDRMTDEIAELREFVKSVKFTMEKVKKHHLLPEGHDCEMLRQQIARSSELLNK